MKDKLSEAYKKMKAVPIPNIEQTETGIIFVEDFAAKIIYLIGYHPYGEDMSEYLETEEKYYTEVLNKFSDD